MMQCCHIMQPLPRGSIQHPHRRLPHLLFLLFLYSLTSCSNGITAPTKKDSSVPLLGAIPDTPFRCLGHSAGYYADPDTGCQVYHMCDSLERQYSYLCPNYTLFNQKFMVCDHWYMVDCSTSHTFYHLNSHIGEVPEKSEGEEEQNAITVEPQEEAPPRSKGTPTRTPLSGPALPSPGPGSPQPSNRPSKDTRKSQPALKQSGIQSVKATVFRTPTKPGTSSIRSAFTTSTIKPTTSLQSQFAPPLTTQPNAPPSKQPFTPPSRQPVIPPRQPITPKTRHIQTSTKEPFFSIRQPNTPTRQLFTSLTRQSNVSATSKPVTQPTRQTVTQPTRQTVTQPTRQTVTQPTRQTVTQPTRQTVTQPTSRPVTQSARQTVTQSARQTVTQSARQTVTQSKRQSFSRFSTEVSASIPEAQRAPSSLLTPPRIELRNHNIDTFIANNHSSLHTHTVNPSLSAKKNTTLPNVAHTHRSMEKDASTQTEQPSTDLTMMPGSVARSPGNRFSFSSHKEEEIALTPEELQRIVFQPLLTRPRTKTRRILTSAPSLLPIDPADSSDPHHHHFPMRIEFPPPVIPEDSSSRSSLDLKLSNSQGVQTKTPILQPPSVSPALHPLSSFLSPPTHPFTPITGMKQEFPTPLATPQKNGNLRTSPRDTFLPGARRLPFPPSTRSNRDFFIPSAEFSLLVSELPQNIVEEPAHDPSHSMSDHHHHHGDHMTMVFPAPIGPSKMEELKLNPECPRCHPEFLKPGQCHPCVVIK